MKTCHTGNSLLFEKDGVRVWIGGEMTGGTTEGMDLAILTGDYPVSSGLAYDTQTGPGGQEVWVVRTSNFKPPDLRYGNVYYMWDTIVNDKHKSVLIMCPYGHGRSGTLALALAAVAGAIPDPNIGVLWLKERHCQNSGPESKQQKEWLAKNFNVR